jgi:predicted outer membrane repeat protein
VSGPAIYVYGNSLTNISIQGVDIEDTLTTGSYAYGGAIYADYSDSIDISNVDIQNTYAGYIGGAIYANNLTITDRNLPIAARVLTVEGSMARTLKL